MGNRSSNSRPRGPQQYQAMVEDAVSALKEHPGSTQADIFKYLENKYSERITPKVRKILQNVLKSVIRTKPAHRGPRSLARGSKVKRKSGARGGAPRGRGGRPRRASAGRKAGPGGRSGRNLKKGLIKKMRNKPGRGNPNKKQKQKSRNLKMLGRKLKLTSRGNGSSSRKMKPVLKGGAKTLSKSYHKSKRPGRTSARLNPRLARDSSRASGRASNRASARPSRHNSSKIGRGGQRHRSVKVVTCCQRRVVSGRGRN